jgi:hypothetical protein
MTGCVGSALLLGLCLVSALADCSAPLKGGDISGDDLGAVSNITDYTNCCAPCQQKAGCTSFVYVTDQQVCYLKSSWSGFHKAAETDWAGNISSGPTPPPMPTPKPVPTPPVPPAPTPDPKPSPAPSNPPIRTLWPKPRVHSYGAEQNVAQVAASFEFTCASCPAELSAAVKRYKSIVFFAGQPTTKPETIGATIAQCSVTVANSTAPLELGMDESYTLNISLAGVATIHAETQWGAIRALETFSQTVQWQSKPNAYTVPNLPISIVDSPRFRWRGET